MLMNRDIKDAIRYIQISFLLIILLIPVLYVAGAPLVSYLVSKGRMIMIAGAPGYPHEYNPELSDIDIISSSIADISKIDKPEQGTQYGSIYCERIGLSVALYFGDDAISLQKGAGQYPLSGLPGRGRPILISGHDITFFAPLELITEGDIINIVTEYGSFDYELVGTLITDASDTTAYKLTLNREQLILYTCYPFGKLIGDRDGRIFFYCDPVTSD
ncbi:MAG: class D sortase [Anaerolineaceae bacterium]|nr:MAG: class D sortase [Anaerolineaceae bacterium]